MVLIGDFYSNYHSHLVYFTELQVKVNETDWWRSSRVTLAIAIPYKQFQRICE